MSRVHFENKTVWGGEYMTLEIDEEKVIKDYNNGLQLAKLCKEHRISSFDLGMILGRHGVDKRFSGVYKYTPNQARIRSDGSTSVPRMFKADFEGTEIVTWRKTKDGEYMVTVG